jgi:CubicO group peptidase (beta-lactamase class C family)
MSSRHSFVRADWMIPLEFLERLPSLLRLATLPGLSMAVMKRGSLAWSWSYGVLNANTGEAVRPDTLFEAASMSKPVFAYAVLQLAEQGRIDMDRPLVSYLKPSYFPNDPLIDQVTARHVLTHSAGFADWGDERDPTSFKPRFVPGARFNYSGEGFFWLQLVVERIAGMGFDTFMRRQLLEPAGMRHSTFAWDVERARLAAYGHERGRVVAQPRREVLKRVEPFASRWGKAIRDWSHEDWLRALDEASPRQTPRVRVAYTNSAASLLTTAEDYCRFLELVMERRRRASWEISEATRRAMLSPQIAVQPQGSLWWGLGWTLQNEQGGLLASHEGNNDNSFTCFACAQPEQGLGLVVLTNGGSGFRIYQRIVRAATGLDPLSFIANLNAQSG